MIKTQKVPLIAAAIFLLFGGLVANTAPSLEIGLVLHILLLAVYLFSFEIVGIDVAAISILVLLGLFGLVGPIIGLSSPLVDPNQLFTGFSSNAVMSIIAVMIIGAGLDKTGIMTQVASLILRLGGKTEARVIPLLSSTVAFISSFMQNVGAAALFLPVANRISARSGLPISRLLMPLGFCAILGGTLTMVGSSPLILLNDLIVTSNANLPAAQHMDTFGLFAVTPVGIILVASGIFYFVLFGRLILPCAGAPKATQNDASESCSAYLNEVYGICFEPYEVQVPIGSPLVSKTLDEIDRAHKIRVLGLHRVDGTHYANAQLTRHLVVEGNATLAILAEPADFARFVEASDVSVKEGLSLFQEDLDNSQSGIGEVVIPPASQMADKSARDLWLRRNFGLSLLAIFRNGKTVQRLGEGVRDLPLQPGDTLLTYTHWKDLNRLESDPNFVVVTTEYPHEELRPQKVGWALIFFVLALGLVLFSDLKLSIALLSGAIGMILSGVIRMDEAYRAVSWKTVFLLASLIPLGMAVESSGTAKWIAEQTLALVGQKPVWIIQTAVAVLATLFSLVMSNVGATVLLVPLAINIALGAGGDPALFALTVGIATSNAFLIPTHQVNALIMGPGGYRVSDFLRAGGIMTVLFLLVMLSALNIFY